MTVANSVLIVDDEFLIVEFLTIMMEDFGLDVCGSAATADEAVRLAQLHQPEVVLMDMRLKGQKDGVDAALIIYETVGSKVIFITGSREPATVKRIDSDHPVCVLFKPVSDAQLRHAVNLARGGPSSTTASSSQLG